MSRQHRWKKPGETYDKRQREIHKKYKGLVKTGRRLIKYPAIAESKVSAKVMSKVEQLVKDNPRAGFKEIGTGWCPIVNPSILHNMCRSGSIVVREYVYVLDTTWQGEESIRFKVVKSGRDPSGKAPYFGTFLLNLGELTIQRLSG